MSGKIRILAAAEFLVDAFSRLLLAGMLMLGSYLLFQERQMQKAADPGLTRRYRPQAEADPGFAELCVRNPDVVAWLQLEGTGIDYPVVQGRTNEEYLNRNAQGESSLSGALFLDSSCARDFSGFNSIIYGHHMDSGMMFGNLDRYADPQFFAAHSRGSLYFEGRSHPLEILALACVDAYDPLLYRTDLQDAAGRKEYRERLLEQAVQKREKPLREAEQLVLFSTCTSGGANSRYLLAAALKN